VAQWDSIVDALSRVAEDPVFLARIRVALEERHSGPELSRSLAVMMWSTNRFGGQIRGWTRGDAAPYPWAQLAVDTSPVPFSDLFGVTGDLLQDKTGLAWSALRALGLITIRIDRRGERPEKRVVRFPGNAAEDIWKALVDAEESVRLRDALLRLEPKQRACVEHFVSSQATRALQRRPISMRVLPSWLPKMYS